LGITKGSEITITGTGEDEREAVAALIKLVENKFGEA
jgi:phosphotransferase system HPr-like phosphotransfer protein